MGNITFQKALEVIESLPEEQRESLIDIIKRRLIEERRDRLAQKIKKAREEYKHGEVKRGTVDDLMDELLK
jgi:U3 small nucleolar ribonucleoprotein component